jgi:hypothetical protein
MPKVTLRTEVDGREEIISEDICDWPDCPHPASHLVGVVSELRIRVVICDKHAAEMLNRTRR